MQFNSQQQTLDLMVILLAVTGKSGKSYLIKTNEKATTPAGDPSIPYTINIHSVDFLILC